MAFVAAQTPAPAKPATPPPIPANVVAKSDLFSAAMQWEALACTARISSSTGELGTAVVVGIRDGAAYLLTANHVVSGTADRTVEFFTKDTYRNPRKLKITETPVYHSPLADLALLKVHLDIATKPGIKVMKMPQPWDRPKKFPEEALSIGCAKGDDPTCLVEKIVAKVLVRRANDGGTFFWQTKDPPTQGRSGGPLVDKHGRLIGICTANQEHLGYYSHLDEIHVALKEGGYSWIWETK